MSNSFAQSNLLLIAGLWEVNNTGPTSMNVHGIFLFLLFFLSIFDHKYIVFKFGKVNNDDEVI